MINLNTKKIIEKWYKILNFPAKYDAEFYNALNEIKIEDVNISQYDIEEKDGKKNFLSFLYMCEELSKKYKQKGISEDILLDTLFDLVRWLDIWSELEGSLYLGQLDWLQNHVSMNLFKLGRLQFAFGKAECDVPEKNIKKGDNIIEVHIPEEGPLIKEECEKSFERARKFFKKFYPDYEYKFFTCHSWLMDENLKELLKPESNILLFQSMFEIYNPEESYAILKYVFKWNTTKENLNSCVATSSFAKRIKEWVNDGKKFYSSLGVIDINGGNKNERG